MSRTLPLRFRVAAMPTTSAVRLVEYFNIPLSISLSGSLRTCAITVPPGADLAILAGLSAMPCERAKVWKTSPAYISGLRTGSHRAPPLPNAPRATVQLSRPPASNGVRMTLQRGNTELRKEPWEQPSRQPSS